MKSVFEQMAAVRAKAVVLRQGVRAWRVNPACLAALRSGGDIGDSVGSYPNAEFALFGLPVMVDRDDQAPEPLFRLIAERPQQG